MHVLLTKAKGRRRVLRRRTLRTSGARARFLPQGCLLHPFRERYTFATTRARAFSYRGVFYTPSVNVTRSQQRSQQLRNDIVFALLRVPSSRESVSLLVLFELGSVACSSPVRWSLIAGDQRKLCRSWRSCSWRGHHTVALGSTSSGASGASTY